MTLFFPGKKYVGVLQQIQKFMFYQIHFHVVQPFLSLQPFMPLIKLRCSPDVHHFLCQAFFPACIDDIVYRPCREECHKVLSDCKDNMQVFGISWPPELQCEK